MKYQKYRFRPGSKPARDGNGRRAVSVSAGLLCAWAMTSLTAYAHAAQNETPPGVEQIIPRGRIAAVTEPQFVSADEAAIPDDAWVLGVELEGEARAYSLNLLNAHEVVNDSVGDKDFAAVW